MNAPAFGSSASVPLAVAPPAVASPRAAALPRALGLAVAALVLLRLGYWLYAPPNSDEAYYWLWGRHPCLSYFDHPPLLAWIQGAFHTLLGRSNFVLRLPSALTTLGTVALLARLVQRLGGGRVHAAGALAAAALLGSPLMLMLTSFAWHDHLLVFFVALSGSLFCEFLAEVAAGGRGRTWLLLGGAAALGLGALSKYSAVFVAVGLIATIALEPRLRRLLRDPRLWLAGAVCLAVLSPVLLWNAENGLASFKFHLVDRHNGFSGVHFRPHGLAHFLGPTILLLSLPLMYAMWAGMRAKPAAGDVFATVYRRFALAVFASSTAVFVGLAIPAWSQYYWNVVAYVLLLPPAALVLAERPRLLRAHLGVGLVVATVLVVHATVLPLSVIVPSAQDDDSREIFGWDAVAEAVNDARQERPVDLLGAADYRPASHLAWALGDPDVAVLSSRPSEFQYWPAPGKHAGASALLVTDHRAPIGEMAGRFERVSLVRRIPIVRAGVELKEYELWRAEGLHPAPAP